MVQIELYTLHLLGPTSLELHYTWFVVKFKDSIFIPSFVHYEDFYSAPSEALMIPAQLYRTAFR